MKKFLTSFIVLLIICILVLIFTMFFNFTVEIGNKIYPAIQTINGIGILVSIIFILGLFIKKKRSFFMSGLIIISYYFGFILWITSTLIVYPLWGITGIIMGFMLAGIGIIPLAFIATIIHGLWLNFWSLIILGLLSIVLRAIPFFIERSIYNNDTLGS